MRTVTQVKLSEHVGDMVRTLRLSHGWSMAHLAAELYDHRCAYHPDGWEMSPAVIATIERGTYAQHGYDAFVRAVTVDEMFVFAEVFDVDPADLMPKRISK